MPEPIRMRINRMDGDVAQVRVLIGHPMETGLRKDPKTNELVPLHFIKNVTVTHNGKTVLHPQWSQAISKNPFLEFRVRNARPDDEIAISWLDNRGETSSTSGRVPAAAN